MNINMLDTPEGTDIEEIRSDKRKKDKSRKETGKVLFSFITGETFISTLVVPVFLALFALSGIISINYLGLAIIFFCINFAILIFGKVEVRTTEIVIIERFGRYWKQLNPGLNFIIPGVDRMLFEDEITKTLPNVKIKVIPLLGGVGVDFADSTEKVDFGANIQIVDPVLGAYTVQDQLAYLKNLIENPAKSAFGKVVVEQALEQRDSIINNIFIDLENKKIGEYEDENGNLQKLTGKKSLEMAGIRLVSLYFNDVILGQDTQEERKKIFGVRQEAKIAGATVDLEIQNTKVESQRVLKAEQLKLIAQKGQEGVRLGLEAIAGVDETDPSKRMSIKEASEFQVNMVKYHKGVAQISEINIQGNSDDPRLAIAGLASIAGKTVEESKRKTPEKETEG